MGDARGGVEPPESLKGEDGAAMKTRECEQVEDLACGSRRFRRLQLNDNGARRVKNDVAPEEIRRGIEGLSTVGEKFSKAGRREKSRRASSPDSLVGDRIPTGGGYAVANGE